MPRNGPPLDVSLSVSPILDTTGQVIGVSTIARDITERKGAEAAARRLAQLEDRNRIARDLHDTTLQDLIAIGMQLHQQSRRRRATPGDLQRVDLVKQMDEAVHRLRTCIFALRHDDSPSTTALTDYLRATIRNAVRILGHQPTLTVHGPADQLPPTIAREITTVTHEALSNIARHAHATTTALTLQVTPDQVSLTIEDNGQGLPDRPAPGDGLANLTARAHARGGHMNVTSIDTGGTRLHWHCPAPGRAADVRGG